ncbi:ribonuclease Oy [Drosophila subobscura]|uniref:ribonuclease Oy n=1 Tax=Drosophila subobscura TaxID=7241 RepID=UPI00155AAB45|nr:ribonuclease Oy [Drosophila subobscura]
MQSQQVGLVIVFLCCCLVATKSTPLSVHDDISDSYESASVSVEKQPQRKPLLDNDSDDGVDDDDSLYPFDDSRLVDDPMGAMERHQRVHDHNWDVLIFTQQWPVTTCYHWREDNPSQECTLPQKKEFWTIHGIWPTKLGSLGPSFCNNSAEFDVDKLDGISNRLETYWPDLKGATSQEWLWKHEWQKHGTCAMLIEELDDELKYFAQGLSWREQYIMSRILDASDIHPDSNNTVTVINNAIVKVLGKNPSIHCLFDTKHEISYLSEIRICFNKSLELIDCDGVKLGDAVSIKYPGGNVTTNCHISSLVHYPSLVPTPQRKREWKFPLVNVYKLLQFLMWFTL